MNSEEFNKVTAFFHDGILDRFEQHGKDIKIWMCSAQMNPEWLIEYPVKVDAENYIRGILHCNNLNDMIINDISENVFIQKFDCGDILDFEIINGQVKFLVVWYNLSKEEPSEDCQEIVIQANTIYWEHVNYVRDPEWNLSQKFQSNEDRLDIYAFKKVEHFFLKGLLDRVELKNKDINIWMTSDTLPYKWLKDNPLKVSAYRTIRGVLHCINVKKIVVDGTPDETYIQKFDVANIQNVEMFNGGVKLLVAWNNFFQESLTENEEIIIEAETIYWEHINFARPREWNITLR